MKNISLLLRKDYIIVYFELHYVVIWLVDYLKSGYPDGSIIMLVKINDDINTTEKIFLSKPDERHMKLEERRKYKPLLKKEDIKGKYYRVLKFMEEERSKELLGNKKPLKLSIEICLYTNNKLISISEEDFFFNANSETEMHKYQFYPNSNLKFGGKKFANLHFNFMFKIDKIPFEEKHFNIYYNKYLNMFSKNKKEKLLTYKEDSELELRYYDIINNPIRNITTPGINLKNFTSMNDFKDVDGILKNENTPIEGLLDLLSSENMLYKYELYEILKRFQKNFLCKGLNEDTLQSVKEKLLKLMDEFKDNKEIWDRVLVPLLFSTLRKTFYKENKISMGRDVKSARSGKNSGNDGVPQKYAQRSIEMVINIFQISFHFIHPNNPPAISLTALNYINKTIEESALNALADPKKKTSSSEEYFISFIVVKKKYLTLCDLLLYMSDNPSCVQPITTILLKILKMKKEEAKELINTLIEDKFTQVFKEILNTHDCNAIIMNNVICILYHIIEYMEIKEFFEMVTFQKLKEIFITFRHTFDHLHESIIYLIRTALIKKSSAVNTTATNTKSIISPVDDNEYTEIIVVFAYAIQYIRIKFHTMNDISKLVKSIFGLLSHVYTICNIINNINEKNAIKVNQVCLEKRVPELLIECLNTINEKEGFTKIDKFLDRLDIYSINTKMIVFRTLFHCIFLFESLRKMDPRAIVKIKYFILF
jgi:hypothetical protein